MDGTLQLSKLLPSCEFQFPSYEHLVQSVLTTECLNRLAEFYTFAYLLALTGFTTHRRDETLTCIHRSNFETQAEK